MRTADVLENSVPVTSLPLMQLLNNADDIIHLRFKIWATEFAFSPWHLYRAVIHNNFTFEPVKTRWKAMPPALFGSASNDPTSLFPPSTRIKECIPLLRSMKRDLLALLVQRRKFGGRLHPDSQRWVQNWERHPWPTYWARPWDAIDLPKYSKIDTSQIQDLIATDQRARADGNLLTVVGPGDAAVGAEAAPVLDLSAPAR